MKRKKCLILLCHCILNCNAKVGGLAEYQGAQQSLLTYLIDNGYGLIQLPCPEITMYGVKRWGHVKEQFNTPYYRKHCREIFLPIREQIIDYLDSGYTLKTLIGIDGSPSCGIYQTCSSISWGGEMGATSGLDEKIKTLKTINSPGVFIEEIAKILRENNIQLDFIAVDETNPESSIGKIINILEGVERLS